MRCAATVYNRDGRAVAMDGLYRGASCFLICSGPSLREQDLSALDRRGVLTMGLNNSPALFRPNLWCYVDAPGKWIEQTWLDPAVLKFVPVGHFGQRFRVRDRAGRLKRSAQTVGEMPAVFGYYRNARFDAGRFLTERSFNWGCDEKIADDAGVRGTRTVFLVALKLLYFLGVQTVYLLGTDWRMEGGQPYAFAERKASPASNNGLYRVTRRRLARLLPYFAAANFRIVNCTPGSRLDLFETMSFARAVDTASIRKAVNTEGMH